MSRPSKIARAEAILDLAALLRAQGDLDRSIAAFSQAIELAPERGDCNYWRGQVWAMNEDLDRAIDDFTQAIEKDPDFTLARWQRGVAFFRIGDIERAKEDFRHARGHKMDAWELETREPQLSGLESLYNCASDGIRKA